MLIDDPISRHANWPNDTIHYVLLKRTQWQNNYNDFLPFFGNIEKSIDEAIEDVNIVHFLSSSFLSVFSNLIFWNKLSRRELAYPISDNLANFIYLFIINNYVRSILSLSLSLIYYIKKTTKQHIPLHNHYVQMLGCKSTLEEESVTEHIQYHTIYIKFVIEYHFPKINWEWLATIDHTINTCIYLLILIMISII